LTSNRRITITTLGEVTNNGNANHTLQVKRLLGIESILQLKNSLVNYPDGSKNAWLGGWESELHSPVWSFHPESTGPGRHFVSKSFLYEELHNCKTILVNVIGEEVRLM